MDRERVLNWCVFTAICLISYSKETTSFPLVLDSSLIFRKISQTPKIMSQQAVLPELQESREKLDLASTLTRTPREVRTNHGNHLTTSNLIPRGQYQPNENSHGSVVNPVLSQTIPEKSNHNLHYNIEKGPLDISDLGPGHGTPVKPWDQPIDEDYYLTVIPLKKQ